MTFIGKLFVLLNVTISLLMAGLAFALYSTRIDWSDNPAKQGKPEGETLTLRNRLVKELGQVGFKGIVQGATGSQGAALSWEQARLALLTEEALARGLRPRYGQELRKLLNGPKENPPAVRVVLLREHFPILDANQFPTLSADNDESAKHNGKPLYHEKYYEELIKEKRRDSTALDAKISGHYRKDIEHTDRLVGNTDKLVGTPPRPGTDPGLLNLLAADREKREGLQEELQLVESQDINTQIDTAAVRRSYESVEERIDELERFLAKRGVTFTRWKDKKGTSKKD